MNFFKNLASLAGGYGGNGAMSGFLGQKPAPTARLDAGGATPLPPSNNPWWQQPQMPTMPGQAWNTPAAETPGNAWWKPSPMAQVPDWNTVTPDPNMPMPPNRPMPGRDWWA